MRGWRKFADLDCPWWKERLVGVCITLHIFQSVKDMILYFIMNNNSLVTRHVISLWVWQVTSSMKFMGKLPHSWPKDKSLFMVSHTSWYLYFISSFDIDIKYILSKVKYCQTSNIRCTLGNKIVDHSDAVGASPVGAATPSSSFLT